MIPVLMITESSGGIASTHSSSTLHLQARRRRPRQGGDQVDVAVRAGPHVAVLADVAHRRVADGAGERRAVLDHVVEERLVAADPLGDHVEEAPLQIGDRVVELGRAPW